MAGRIRSLGADKLALTAAYGSSGESMANDCGPLGFADLEERLLRTVIGQESCARALIQCYKRFRAGLGPKNRPQGIFLLVGPTGCGKTYLAKQFAQAVTGSPNAPLRIDCAEYSQSHEVSRLIGCFVPETAILMSDGSRKAIKDICVGDLVLSGQGTAREVQDTYEYQFDGNLVEIRVAGSAEPIHVTPGHQIWAKRGWNKRPTTKADRDPKRLYTQEGFADMSASDLVKGDVLCYPRLRVDQSKQLEYVELAPFSNRRVKTYAGHIAVASLARIAGYYVSEGGNSKTHRAINFTFGLHERHLVDDLCQSLESIGFKSRVETRKSSFRVYVAAKALASAFASWFGDRVDRKRIPEWLLHAPDAVVWDFLDAALMGDGGKTVRRRVDYSTISETLASQMELLIRRLGFVSQLQKHKPARVGWRSRYRIYVSGAQLPEFISHCKFLSHAVVSDWGANQRQNEGIQRNQGVDESYIYARILSIKEVQSRGAVYDFSVADDHAYVTAFRAHNSPPG